MSQLPHYARAISKDLLVRFRCNRACGMHRYGRTSEPLPIGLLSASDEHLYKVSCLWCGGVQSNAREWERVFPFEGLKVLDDED